MKKERLLVLAVVAIALLCVLGLTLFMQNENSVLPDEQAKQELGIGDPGQVDAREDLVDMPETVVDGADTDYIDVSTNLEAIPQDAGEATQEELSAYWEILGGASSSYEKVKAYDMLLTGFRNMIMRGEEPDLIERFPFEQENATNGGFTKTSLSLGSREIELYSIVLPQTATLSSSRCNVLGVLRENGAVLYSDFLVKKDNKLLESAVPLGERIAGLYGAVMDEKFGTPEQTLFVKSLYAGEVSLEFPEIKPVTNYGTIVVSNNANVLYMKSGVEGVYLMVRPEMSDLQFTCSDGSETLIVKGDDSGLSVQISKGESQEHASEPSTEPTDEPSREQNSVPTEPSSLLDDVEIPQFN